MKKIKNIIKNNGVSFMLGALMFGGIGVAYAAVTGIVSSDLGYTTEKSSRVENIKDAIDYLYEKAPIDNGDSSEEKENINYSSSISIGINTVETILTNENYYDYYASHFVDYIDGSNNGVLYHHTNDLDYGAQDNSYRFSGKNPNNWICFGYEIGGSDPTKNESVCDDLRNNGAYAYRIIGWFDDDADGIYNMKIIANSPNGYHYWTGDYIYAFSDFNSSTLFSQNLNGDSNSIKANFINNGWENYIIQPTWYVGGVKYQNRTDSTAKGYYNDERGPDGYGKNNQNTNYLIGLMYVSDYLYATLQEYWRTGPFNAETDWMYIGNDWTISKYADYDRNIAVAGNGIFPGVAHNSSRSYRATLYLNSNVKLSGDGTVLSPYMLSLL